MPSRSFALTTTTTVPPTAVVDFLADLTRHRGLHPFLVSATVVDRSTDGARQDWQVVERPRLGPWRYTLRFPARLVRDGVSDLHSEVRAAPGCHLATDTAAAPDPDGRTRVTERCTVTAPWFLIGYMTRQAHDAHARTFALLPGELERRC